MSGIAGFVDLQGGDRITAETLKRMVHSLAHRGPAGNTSRYQAGIAMGALHTYDPASGGPQPFVDESGDIWAVLEGRLFNHTVLEQQLRERGVRLKGRSAAELVAQMYVAVGDAFVEQLEGEFALVVWDGRRQRLFAARDRLGIHHMFYAVHDGVLYFASEIKAILASGHIARRLDLRALDQVFFMNCPVAPRTMFEGVTALPAGHVLSAQDGDVNHRMYWDLDLTPDTSARSETAYREQLLALLREAVRVRIPGDRPVGVYLSGGLDSSAVTMLMRETMDGAFPAYFVDFGLRAYSERHYADLVAGEAGVSLNTVEMSYPRIAASFPKLIWHGESPVVLMEAASLLPLARAAVQDVSLVLTGEGGDELLAGYVFNDWDRIYRRLQRFPLSLTLPLIRALLPGMGFPKAFVLSAAEQRPALEHFGCFPAPLYYNYAVREVTAYYSDDVRAHLRDYCPEADIAQTLNTAAMARWSPLAQSLYFSTKVNLANYLLGPHGDRAAAAAGLDAAFPFLDQHLVEFAARLPDEFKVRGGQEKYLLKRALEGIVPDAIVQRKKSPMTSPTSPAFLGPDAPAYVQRLLSPDVIKAKGYFDGARVTQMLTLLRNRDLSKDRNNRMDVMLSFPLVAVLSVQIFDELFIQNFYEQAPVWDGEELG